MAQPTQVQKLIFKMLHENTGIHMLDSGFDNGRHWQQNAKKTIKDFMNEPAEKFFIDIREATERHEARVDLSRTVSVFHYLSGLELDGICNKFNRRNNKAKDWDGGNDQVYGVSQRAWDWLESTTELKVKYVTNTYNYDCDLSQTLQYTELEIFGETYFLMQIHNGADVRGGYTDAKLFRQATHTEHIHEWLWDYKSESEIIDDIKEGYLTEFYEYLNESELVPIETVLAALDIEVVAEEV
jgi:hypothetical protein